MMKKNIYTLCAILALSACVSHNVYETSGGQYKASQSFYMQKGEGHYKIGNPYDIFGITYYPKEDYNYVETGVASWYGEDFHAKDTANGEEYNMNTMTAAHRTLPLPSIVKVTNLENGKQAIFRVNDRGPFAKNRIIDISKKGAEVLGFQNQGTAQVKVEIMAEESKALKNILLSDGSVGYAPFTGVVKETSVDYLQPITSQNYLGSNKAYNDAPLQPKTSGQYYVQVGAFNQKLGAETTKEKLSGFSNTKIYPANIGSGTFYRVRIGPYANKEQANSVLNQVKDMGYVAAKTIED